MRAWRQLILIFAVLLAVRASAALPLGALPSLPSLPLPAAVDRTLSKVSDTVDARALTQLRQLQVRELLRTQRRVLEADPAGAPVIRGEVLAFDPSDDALLQARATGFTVAQEQTLDGLGARIVVLRVPAKLSTRQALERLRQLDARGVYDFNHVYTESGVVTAAPAPSAGEETAKAASTQGVMKIGLVDGGVDPSHPVFDGVVIHHYGCADRVVPSLHGTAVASLIAGHAENFVGAAPGAELYAADVYCNEPRGGSMDRIAQAIAWLAREQVPVINVSLVGPRNLMLENVVRLATGRGHLIVAAVGNDGPAAPPLYPASYPGVIGVTGVDARREVLLEACRGPQVVFAAPGMDMAAALMSQSNSTAHSKEQFATVRGTSFASPIVASLLAAQLNTPNKTAAEQAVARLEAQAIDLGAPGTDTVYGHGLVGEGARVAPALVHAQAE